jgi:DNA-3-methyladenine glycosylase
VARAGAGVIGGRKLPRAFFARDARVVARELLGKVLVHRHRGTWRAARIVETEAYHGPDDQASHARFGPTARAAIMFGPPAVAYVYLVYGRSHCVNAVTGPEGFPSAVLLRAGEPVAGCLHSTRGPGNLCRALGIRREADNGRDLCGDVLYLVGGPPPARVASGPRVNVHYAGRWAERPWRYAVAGSPWVSRPVPGPTLSPARRRRGAGAASPARPAAPRPARAPRTGPKGERSGRPAPARRPS